MAVSTDHPGSERVSTLELFLDLVFVFTVTQLTELVAHPNGLGDYGKAALILAVTFWMYDGYVWLTGNLSMAPARNRIGIFLGMAGYLVMALAIPRVFTDTDDAVIFGLAYIGVTLIHTVMFSTAPNSSARAIWRIAPFNLAGAALVLAAAFVADDWRWLCWLGAILVITSSTFFGRLDGWTLSASHFVERHGLVIIVALGESVIAIGAGTAGLQLDGGLVVTAVLALGVSAALWWVYFDHDDEAADRVMSAATGDTRSHLGLLIVYAHLVMIAGIIVAAAGIKSILSHPTDPAETAAAWNLATGLAIYLAGESLFRYMLGLGTAARRLVALALVLVTVPIGLVLSGVAQLAAAFTLLVLLLVSEAVHTPTGAERAKQATRQR